ncbi:carbohydrate kinase [Ornithinimicrobium faecis]|uniref:Carbohydrate kinase n=1 Tax=Ornithinimicrobium faecis TaxID=2934158 RepID=A0ABY4YWQ2_9MICO|nr:carbohydrate kinase [Ornithinimicrobium sp. HY1793]USQ80959.1 carbohydrate kinase [Ornithinimicrobium sp. HY1793]
MTRQPHRTLVVGEALIDIVVEGQQRQEHVGGSPANVAIGLAQLGHAADLLTHIGREARGQRITEHLAAAGVHLVTGSDTAHRTPTATAHVDPAGVATYDFDLAWDISGAIPSADTTGPAHVHTGSIAATLEPGASQVLELVQQARPLATISYDPNLRPTIMGAPHDVRSRVEELVGLADVVKVSDEDLQWLYADTPVSQVAHLWGQLGPSVVVLTQGPQGALVVLSGTNEEAVLPAAPAQVVDTVGAGDSFMAGLLSGLLDAGLLGGHGAREALRASRLDGIRPAVERALATAHWTIERAGAAAPTRSDLTI